MARIFSDVDMKTYNVFKRYCIGRGSIGAVVFKAVGAKMWEDGVLLPGYTPDECHLCTYPMSDHEWEPATATEPGQYRCPAIDDEIVF
jgi:hypothetical protein